jgi:hypothetical protein
MVDQHTTGRFSGHGIDAEMPDRIRRRIVGAGG